MMKKFYYTLSILILIAQCFNAFANNYQMMDCEMQQEDKISDEFIIKEGKKLEIKYGMKQIGIGGGTSDKGIGLMTIAFSRYGPGLTEDVLRRIIVDCVNALLKAVNNEEKVRPFLKEYPFTPRNISLSIYNYDEKGFDTLYPHIGTVSCSNNNITYLTFEPEGAFKIKTKKSETYEEAIAILKNGSKE